MSKRRHFSRNISFHVGASEEFKDALLDAYAVIPPLIRQRLESFAGSETLIRTVKRAYDGPWEGLSTSPAYQKRLPVNIPVEDRTLLRFGRHHLTLAEYFSSGGALSPAHIASSLHHEVGHRINHAISGDNYIHPQLRPADKRSLNAADLFSASGPFLEAIRKDLLEAGWPPSGEQVPPDLAVASWLLPRREGSGELDWRGVGSEIFAELYARRFSPSLDEQAHRPPTFRTDFSVFRKAGPLVDRAVATFVAGPILPVNPNPGDYPPGECAIPLSNPSLLERAAGMMTGKRKFEPIGPDAPHPPPPQPP